MHAQAELGGMTTKHKAEHDDVMMPETAGKGKIRPNIGTDFTIFSRKPVNTFQ